MEMPQPTPNLHHLELFYHVVKSGGITAATRSMPYGIQQPAVSGQVSLLESELGVRLFQRRPFKLTPAGEKLFGFVAPFFGKLPEIASEITGKASSHLRLAAPAVAGREHLPSVISEMRKRNRDLELTLIEAGQQEVFQLLEREQVDLAIVETDTTTPPGIRKEILISLPLVLLLPTNVVMPKAGLASLARDYPLIRTAAHTPIARLFAKGLGKLGVSWPSRIEVSTIELVDAYVSRGLGIGVSVRVPGVKFSKGITAIDLDDFPELRIAGLWRGKLHPLAAEVLEGLRKIALAVRK